MAIIVVLAAVAIPTFGRQLETSRETGDMELIRNAYNEALSMAVIDGSDGTLNAANGETDLSDVHDVTIETVEGTAGSAGDPTADPPVAATPGTPAGIKVKVKLADKLKQTEVGWQYVRSDIMNTVVGDGTSTPAKDNEYAEFKFVMGDDGAVKLETTTPVVLSAA